MSSTGSIPPQGIVSPGFDSGHADSLVLAFAAPAAHTTERMKRAERSGVRRLFASLLCIKAHARLFLFTTGAAWDSTEPAGDNTALAEALQIAADSGPGRRRK